MIKKTMKNILLLFIIIYTILSLAMYVYNVVNVRIFAMEMAVRIRYNDYEGLSTDEEITDRIKKEYGEEAPAVAVQSAQSYAVGANSVLEKETTIILVSTISSIAIGIIVTLTGRSKSKEILYFLLIGTIIDLICTIPFYLKGNLSSTNFFNGFIEDFIYNIQHYAIYYVIVYIVIFIGLYFIRKRNADKLNGELKNKQK